MSSARWMSKSWKTRIMKRSGMKVEKIFPQTPLRPVHALEQVQKQKRSVHVRRHFSARFSGHQGNEGGKLPDFDEKTGTFIHLPDSNNDTTQTAFTRSRVRTPCFSCPRRRCWKRWSPGWKNCMSTTLPTSTCRATCMNTCSTSSPPRAAMGSSARPSTSVT